MFILSDIGRSPRPSRRRGWHGEVKDQPNGEIKLQPDGGVKLQPDGEVKGTNNKNLQINEIELGEV